MNMLRPKQPMHDNLMREFTRWGNHFPPLRFRGRIYQQNYGSLRCPEYFLVLNESRMLAWQSCKHLGIAYYIENFGKVWIHFLFQPPCSFLHIKFNIKTRDYLDPAHLPRYLVFDPFFYAPLYSLKQTMNSQHYSIVSVVFLFRLALYVSYVC